MRRAACPLAALITVLAGVVLLASCSREAAPPPGPTGPTAPRAPGPNPQATTITFNVKEDVWKVGNKPEVGKKTVSWTTTYTFTTAPVCKSGIPFDAELAPTRAPEDHPEYPAHDDGGGHWTFDSTSAQFPGCHVTGLNEGAVNGDSHGLVSFDLGPDTRFDLFERTTGPEEWANRGEVPGLDCDPGAECPAACRVAAPAAPSVEHANEASQPHWRIVRGDCVLVAPTDRPDRQDHQDHQARVFTRSPAETTP